jgi:predicted nucleotidyltransferase
MYQEAMRLTKSEIKSIKSTFDEVFGSGDVYLFGSRVDDSKRGGDIDLYIKTNNIQNKTKQKIEFLAKLKQKIGDQKIDVIISSNPNRAIEQEAISDGIKL